MRRRLIALALVGGLLAACGTDRSSVQPGDTSGPVGTAAKVVTDQPMQAPPKPAVNGTARVLPVRPPVQQASPTVAAVANAAGCGACMTGAGCA